MWFFNQIRSLEGADALQWALAIVMGVFWLRMLLDAWARREYFWIACMVLFSFLSAVLYYFFVFRAESPSNVSGFELPGSKRRDRIRELEAQIHHLDKAHLHLELGDIYFQQGKLAKAEACYRTAHERDPEDIDILSHLGQCLLRLGRPLEALPLLQKVSQTDPKHEYGHSAMSLAECLSAIGKNEESLELWRKINAEHGYARARVQLAEMLLSRGAKEEARTLLEEVMDEDKHAPKFQRQREKVWVQKARALSLRAR